MRQTKQHNSTKNCTKLKATSIPCLTRALSYPPVHNTLHTQINISGTSAKKATRRIWMCQKASALVQACIMLSRRLFVRPNCGQLAGSEDSRPDNKLPETHSILVLYTKRTSHLCMESLGSKPTLFNGENIRKIHLNERRRMNSEPVPDVNERNINIGRWNIDVGYCGFWFNIPWIYVERKVDGYIPWDCRARPIRVCLFIRGFSSLSVAFHSLIYAGAILFGEVKYTLLNRFFLTDLR